MRNVDQGDWVPKGTVLALVSQQDYIDKLQQAKAQLDVGRQNRKRQNSVLIESPPFIQLRAPPNRTTIPPKHRWRAQLHPSPAPRRRSARPKSHSTIALCERRSTAGGQARMSIGSSGWARHQRFYVADTQFGEGCLRGP